MGIFGSGIFIWDSGVLGDVTGSRRYKRDFFYDTNRPINIKSPASSLSRRSKRPFLPLILRFPLFPGFPSSQTVVLLLPWVESGHSQLHGTGNIHKIPFTDSTLYLRLIRDVGSERIR